MSFLVFMHSIRQNAVLLPFNFFYFTSIPAHLARWDSYGRRDHSHLGNVELKGMQTSTRTQCTHIHRGCVTADCVKCTKLLFRLCSHLHADRCKAAAETQNAPKRFKLKMKMQIWAAQRDADIVCIVGVILFSVSLCSLTIAQQLTSKLQKFH